MGLLSDFFLQTFFFATVLSVDMNRTELRDAARRDGLDHHAGAHCAGGAAAAGGDAPGASYAAGAANGDVAKQRRRRKHFQHPISGPGMISSSTRTSAEGHLEETSSVLAPQIKSGIDNVLKLMSYTYRCFSCRTEEEKEPKRVRFLNFWAKRRIVQRLFVLCMVVWISMLVYQTSLLETIFK